MSAGGAAPGEPQLVEKFLIRGNDFEHGGEVAAKVKALLKQLGVNTDAVRRLSIANFEAEMNVIMYALEGEFVLEVFAHMIRVTLTDRGPGIPNIDLAMQVGRGNTFSVQAGAGIVADSNPNTEYQETVNKASAMLKAIEMAETNS